MTVTRTATSSRQKQRQFCISRSRASKATHSRQEYPRDCGVGQLTKAAWRAVGWPQRAGNGVAQVFCNDICADKFEDNRAKRPSEEHAQRLQNANCGESAISRTRTQKHARQRGAKAASAQDCGNSAISDQIEHRATAGAPEQGPEFRNQVLFMTNVRTP